jgi:REP-associated tyrosine transposase
MSRPLRIIEPNGWHHVFNRGRHKSKIFRDDADRERFLALMQDCGRRWSVFPVAYCLMNNHFHLLVHDEGGCLDRAMRHLQGVYTQWFNFKYRKDGTLFRGRYRDRLVQEENYLAEVVRYLHINPVEARLVDKAGDYRWSSHRAFLGIESPAWLRVDKAARYVPGGPESPVEFDKFVHERISDEMGKTLRSPRWAALLGDEAFVEEMRNRIRRDVRREDPEVVPTRQLRALDLDPVIDVVRRQFAIPDGALTAGRRGSRNTARLLAVLACRDYTAATGAELGQRFGVRGSTVPSLVRNARKQIREDATLGEAWDQIVARLEKYTQSST